MATARNAARVSWLLVLAACRSPSTPAPSDAASPADGPRAFVPLDATSAANEVNDAGRRAVLSTPDAGPRSASNSASTTILLADAGAGACKLLRPALMQSYGGPAALRFIHPGGAEIAELVFNDAGRPQLSDAPVARLDRARTAVPMPPKTALPGCAVARSAVYCPDANGAIHRTHAGGEGDSIVAQGRAGTPIAAAPLGTDHVVLAYIEESASTEGLVRHAEAMLDDGPSVRLSEEGSGATWVGLVARGDEVIALSIDGRVAMTPTHVRSMRVGNGRLALGRDAVVFVGGSAERHNAGALAFDAEGTTFVLLAVAESAGSFGMAAVRLSDPPTEDEPVVWSHYPNGLDPAPIAATRGVSPIRVARARPTSQEIDAPRVLEVGDLETSGQFRAKCILAEAAYVKDVELELDAQGAMWIFWRDTRGSHLERRALP